MGKMMYQSASRKAKAHRSCGCAAKSTACHCDGPAAVGTKLAQRTQPSGGTPLDSETRTLMQKRFSAHHRRIAEIPLAAPPLFAEERLIPRIPSILTELGPGTKLDPRIASRAQALSPVSLDDVRVHDDPMSRMTAILARSEALTFGNHIVVGSTRDAAGQDRLLAHEIAHTIQQHAGRSGPESQYPEGEAERFADRATATLQVQRPVGLGTTPRRVAPKSTTLYKEDLPGNLLLIVDVDDGDFVGGCIKQIVPHAGVKLVMKGVPKAGGNQIFNVHIGFMTDALGQRCAFFYESVTGLCETTCFASKEELEKRMDEIKVWIMEHVESALKALAITGLIVLGAYLVMLIAPLIGGALSALLA